MRNSFNVNFLKQHGNGSVQKLIAASNERQYVELRKKLPPESSINMQILLGALDIETVDGVEDILRIADSLDSYDFYPDVTTERELGIYLVESGEMDFPENVRNYLDYGRIGTEYHANHSGAFIDTGYVTRQHEQTLDFEKQQGFGMQMQ